MNESLSEGASGQCQAAAPSHTTVRLKLSKSLFAFYKGILWEKKLKWLVWQMHIW